MKWRDHIISDPEVLLGKPTIKGTRLSVEFILERLANGCWSSDFARARRPFKIKNTKPFPIWERFCIFVQTLCAS